MTTNSTDYVRIVAITASTKAPSTAASSNPQLLLPVVT